MVESKEQSLKDPYHEAFEFLSKASFWRPNRIRPSAWVEHVPLAFWIIEVANPGCFVELGTYSGTSYAAFCQAVQTLGLETKCYAIDTWEGDEQTGFYGEEIFADLAPHNQQFYSGFSSLIRSTFDKALKYFEEGSIDLLHIDGYHTYEAVKHDFNQWYPKLSSRAVVLFHDINVREREFGVFRLWKDLQERWPSFEFIHGCGLGILGVGADLRGPLYRLFQTKGDSRVTAAIRSVYANLGAGVQLRTDKEQQRLDFRSELSQKSERISALERDLASGQQCNSELERKLGSRDQRVSDLERELASRNQCVWDLGRELASRNQCVWDLGRELGRQNQRVSDLERELVRQRSESERMRTASGADQEQVAYLQRALAERGHKIGHLERKIQSLKSSRSWQVTAPFRWVDHLFSWKGGLWLNFKDEATILFWRIAVHLPIFHGARVLKHQTSRVAAEGLFDSQWYRSRYEGMPGVSVDPLLHYFILGVQHGCDPNPTFNSKWYLEKYTDVAAAHVNPLFHYIEYGAKSGFRFGPDIDANSSRADSNVNAERLTQLATQECELQDRHALISSNPAFQLRQLAISGRATRSPSVFGRRMICVSHVIPYPPRAGNEYRIHRLLSWLAEQGWDVLLVICPLGHESVSEHQLAEAAAIYQNFIVCSRDGSLFYRLHDGDALLKGLSGRQARSFASLLGETDADENRELENLLRSFCPDLLAELLLHLAIAYDPQVVLAEYVFMTRPFALLRPGLFKIIDTIDVFSTTRTNVLNYGIQEGLSLEPEAEANLINRADLIIAIQAAEADTLRRLAPQRQVINVGVDFDVLSEAPPSATEQVILLVGSDNARNAKGLKDFLRFAWPSVRRALPNAQLRIVGSVGKCAEPPLMGVQILGRVDDLARAYAEARVVINPSVAGTGLKIKTIEAICHLRPIIVWPSGVDGVAPEVRSLCQVATDWFEFTQHVIRLAGDENCAQKLIERRGELVQYFGPKDVYAALGAVLDSQVTTNQSLARLRQVRAYS